MIQKKKGKERMHVERVDIFMLGVVLGGAIFSVALRLDGILDQLKRIADLLERKEGKNR